MASMGFDISIPPLLIVSFLSCTLLASKKLVIASVAKQSPAIEMGIASSLTLLAMTDRRFLQPEQCRERLGVTWKSNEF
jgi:hypothetical protein